MDHEPFDSSGTDDDFPPPCQNRISRGGRISGNGRPAANGSLPHSRMYDDTDSAMGAKIHLLEQEAYSSVLIAFKAQADAISWDKESLMTGLRKELRLSNEEHIDLRSRVNADETIRRIREWRQTVELHQQGNSGAGHEALPSPSVSSSRRKQKIARTLTSQSFPRPYPFYPQAMAVTNQTSSSAPKRGPMIGPKSKKHKFYPPEAADRCQFGNHTSFDSLIGRKVWTRWPDDNNFYEALISNYDPVEGRHALVYDIDTQRETWEWVKLSEISPEDIKWDGEDPGRGLTKSQHRKDFPSSQNGIGKKGPDDIRLLHTDTLIKEVEKVFGASHRDPVEIEKAKEVLKEHEKALNDAIARLAGLSECDTDEAGRERITN